MRGSGQLGSSTQQARGAAQRALRLHQRARHVVVLRVLEPRHEVAHFLLVAVDMIGHHGQGDGGIGRHGAQCARVVRSLRLMIAMRESILRAVGGIGSVRP